MHIFVSITAFKANKKKTAYGKEKNGEKPKILITESVKIGNHSTVFSVGESPNLKPKLDNNELLYVGLAIRLHQT